MTIKKTYKELIEVDSVVGALYTQTPTLKETKFGYAYNKFFAKNTEKVNKEFQDELQDLKIDNALEDEKTKAIILDEKSITGYAHTKAQLKQFFKDSKDLMNKYHAKEIEVEPYISSLVPDMTDEQQEILTGLII